MSWADGVLSVWSWGKQVIRGLQGFTIPTRVITSQGFEEKFDYHIRPACKDCPSVSASPVTSPPSVITSPSVDMSLRSGMTRVAGLSGAAAIALGAYGAHVLNVAKEGVTEEQRKAFEVANR